MNKYHTLTYAEIMSIPSGRIMNMFVKEYVFKQHPTRWSNHEQKDLVCHWFEESPRSIAEDDCGYSQADSLCPYSTNSASAMLIVDYLAISYTPKAITIQTLLPETNFPAMENRFWATFSIVPYESKNYDWKNFWVYAETLPMAICRAALLDA